MNLFLITVSFTYILECIFMCALTFTFSGTRLLTAVITAQLNNSLGKRWVSLHPNRMTISVKFDLQQLRTHKLLMAGLMKHRSRILKVHWKRVDLVNLTTLSSLCLCWQLPQLCLKPQIYRTYCPLRNAIFRLAY